MMAGLTANANYKLVDVPSGITNDRSTASALNMPLSREASNNQMRLPPVISFLFFCVNLQGQNLVPNESFESYIQCPYMSSGVSLGFVEDWNGSYGSVDYYNRCAGDNADFGVPINIWGEAEAHSGDAYIGVVIYKTSVEFREYAEVKLMNSLTYGKKYLVEFYVSLIDSCQYAISSVGMYFSTNGIEGENITQILNHQPQIENSQGFYLDDKEKWEMVSGSFIAQGGEQFITIGNFKSDAFIDTLFVGGSINDNYSATGYYIDDVSVTFDTTTGVNELEQTKFEIYPNPAKEQITIETEKTNKVTTLQITDITGREVFSFALTSAKTTTDLPSLSAGVYTAILFQNEAITARKEIIIQR